MGHSLTEKIEVAIQIVRKHQEMLYPIKSYALFSGGYDSTVLTHLLWQANLIDAVCHINTGIGIEETREYVRSFCDKRGIPLVEKYPEARLNYRDLVLKFGFPGPPQHFVMYRWLKERAVAALVRESKVKYKDKVFLLTGVRSSESIRRMGNVQEIQAKGAQVWLAPLMYFEKKDILDYMDLYEIERNPVVEALHMSGECLCGAFARKGELEEIRFFYPKTAAQIESLEEEVKASGQLKCKWGEIRKGKISKPLKEMPLCATCLLNHQENIV